MDIFKLITTLALTFVALAVFGIVIMYVAVNPHALIMIGLVVGCIAQAFKRK